MGSVVEHDAAISSRQSHAGRLVQKWFDDMPDLPLELWSPTSIFEPLSPLAPTSPFLLSFHKKRTSSLPDDDLRRRPFSSGTGSFSPVLHHTAPSSSLARQGTFLSTPSRTSLVSITPPGSAAETATSDGGGGDGDDDDVLSQFDASSSFDGLRGKMPSSTRAGPDGGVVANDCDTAANGQWRRPKSSRSTKSERSSSPLFKKAWPRGRHINNNTSKDEGWNASKVNLETPAALTPAEFDALPTAIQRKYFSTLERLRFAQTTSSGVDGIYHHYDDISAQHIKRRKQRHHSRQDRSTSVQLARPFRRRSRHESQSPVADSLWYASLPDKIKSRQFTREEQLELARQLRASVILDAADEAIYKIGRRRSRVLSPGTEGHEEPHTPNLSSRPSMASLTSQKPAPLPATSHVATDLPESFLDSFRWLDEEEDLDLRLFLDDYHANLRETVPIPTKERRPSFRRHLSISKIPFGRSSVSSSRPATKDASTPNTPLFSPVLPNPTGIPQGRRRSRAMSLITPRHSPQESLSGIDPGAAHYQDPEARLKLRVYLASPQKFDEAIEFGFPSADALSAAPVIVSGPLKRKSRQKLSDASENMRSFLEDGDDEEDEGIDDEAVEKLDSDHEGSVPDPESPKTPHPLERPPHHRPVRMVTDPTFSHSHKASSDGYAQAPAASREMTLRMTLTRPDLRANEDQIYGWQQQHGPPGRKSQSQSSPLRDELLPVTYIGDSKPKESIEQMFAGIDHWGPDPADKGVMKRFWNRVRRT